MHALKDGHRDACSVTKAIRCRSSLDLDQPEAEVLRACCEHLLAAETDDTYLDKALTTLVPLWQKEAAAVAPVQRDSGAEAKQRLETNEQLMRKLGHYQGGMVWFQGEWFWGLDRLDHLEQLLIDTGLANSATETPTYTRTWAGLASSARKLKADNPARQQPLEIFFSIRSPYSHLGLERAVLLAAAWKIPLVIRPVLPMLMRGQPVPGSKKWYIFHDTRREADKLGIRYGFVADPLGAGVERCYALSDYARSEGREVQYMLNYARAVNAEGIRSETDSGLRIIVERSGLDWEHARTLPGNEDWRAWAEENRKAMYGLGLWGVPGFRYGDTSCWGQDRLWRIEEAIQKKGGI
ncbi:DsbA family protein [Marinobacter sp.]|uniref:DsbA family protein n=1 Tax=Marinobacter sp. TaxID=50741 RepID=UPI00384D9A65